MKIAAVIAATLAAGCTASPPVREAVQEPDAARPAAARPDAAVPRAGPQPAGAGRPDTPIAGFDARRVREEVAGHVAARLGGDAARLAAAAATSVMATHHQGFPRPIQYADGTFGYEAPGANAVVKGTAGWAGWSASAERPVAAARGTEIDRILADPAFWAEPDHVPPTCTDAGARRLVVRHAGRIAVRQQSCGGEGLTGRLWELAFGAPG
jgi:hypothetical protein